MNSWVVPDGMTGQLITLPARLGLRGTRLMLRLAEGAGDLAVSTTLRVAGTVLAARPGRRSHPSSPSTTFETRPSDAASAREGTRGSEDSQVREGSQRSGGSQAGASSQTHDGSQRSEGSQTREGSRSQDNGAGELASERLEREGFPVTPPPTEAAPEHVSEEPELVLESAEPGAEDGVGASVHVLEPWDGYRQMNARSVLSRISQATSAELAAVDLYERAHRSRRTVLEAVERELRTKSHGS